MIICRGTNDTDTQLFTSLFRDKLSLPKELVYLKIFVRNIEAVVSGVSSIEIILM
jgi:hypothetical protein